MAKSHTGVLTRSIEAWRTPARMRLAVRGFLALAVLLAVTITATSATLLYNAATALRDEAEGAATHLAELLSASFAEMGEISLANVARTLDATLDGQMIAQARIAAHLVAAAEEAGLEPPRVIGILDDIIANTVLDEFWITNEAGFSYLTNVRDDRGDLVPFQFDPDPAVQPQASKFYVLLAAPVGGDDFITQPAQVREIDQEVYKYVGVSGVDKPRIVQIGNALVFGEQEILTNVYTSQRADVSAVIEGILGQHMAVQATIVDRFAAAAEAAGWGVDEVDRRLGQIVSTTAIGEIRVVDRDGTPVYSSLAASDAAREEVPHFGAYAGLFDGSEPFFEHPSEPRASDGVIYKYVTVASPDGSRLSQVGIPIESSAGNLLYSVYQREADVLVRSRNLEALWVVNLEGDVTAAAPRAELAAGAAGAAGAFGGRVEAVMSDALAQGRVVSASSLSLLAPEDRGIWVASPLINTGGIPIGGLAVSVSLDDIALTVQGEALNTALIAFALLGLTAFAAAWGTRWLTHPIEVIADAARQVEAGNQPEDDEMEDVLRRQDELGSLARVFTAMTVQVFNREEQLEMLVSERTRDLEESNHNLRVAKEAMEQDLEMAKVVQAALVREGTVEMGVFSACARMTPAQRVGGDFVDVMEPSPGRRCLVVGDVSGKGVAAALFMAASQAAIKAAFSECDGIDAVTSAANDRVCRQNPMGLFVTAVLAVVDPEKGAVEYVCAGHDPAYLIGSDDVCRSLPVTGGLAMGVMEEFAYASRRQVLQPGETLVLYTDGLTDAVNAGGELFGKERLEAALVGTAHRTPSEVVHHAWSEIGAFSAGMPAADDMTCLVLRRH
ncbi:MAG: SpoIIE family protein phosphatase [Acidobacteria bacterium]|nr:SpoIIE family protein phosphatase [Acidobacteriota bacterium]